ncbi:MAG TPA: dihydrodipicolinate synthase family protein [Burkholderiales bacterium]|nr:dihydrodipicolinate synthase family protein [Burkholderiales bacterium]
MPDLRAALKGISGVPVTPFDERDRVAPAPLRALIGRLAAAGVDNLVAAGNTGEFYALELQEILAVYAEVAQANAGRSAVTAGVGRSLKEAIVLARAAEKEGFDALMIHQPPDPFASPAGMVAYNHAVAGATRLPVLLYIRRDVFSDEEFSKLLDQPNIVGMKYAFPDAPKLAERIRACRPLGKIAVCGLAEPWAAPFQAVGAQGFTSGLVNVLPQLSVQVRDALARGDYETARAACERIAPFEAMRAMQGSGWNVTVVKQAMRAMGHAVGPARPPASPELPSAFAKKLESLLGEWECL